MIKENVWTLCGIIGAVLGLIYFNISTAANFFLGMGLGMFVGLLITTILKLFGVRFINSSNSYNSNSSNRNSYDSCCDSWDD